MVLEIKCNDNEDSWTAVLINDLWYKRWYSLFNKLPETKEYDESEDPLNIDTNTGRILDSIYIGITSLKELTLAIGMAYAEGKNEGYTTKQLEDFKSSWLTFVNICNTVSIGKKSRLVFTYW